MTFKTKILAVSGASQGKENLQSRPHLFHVLKHHRSGNRSRCLLDDLLVAALHGAVPAKEGDGVAVLVCQDLHLQVPRLLGQSHDKDWGARDFGLNLRQRQHRNGHIAW